MLAGAGFRDHALLAHAHGEQALPEAVIDFVRAGVEQVFALDINARAAEMLGEPRSNCSGVGRPAKFVQQIVEFRLKCGIGARLGVGPLEFFERRHERFGNVASAVRAVAAARVRHRLRDYIHADLLVFRASSRRTHQCFHARRVLLAGPCFHAAAHIHGVRPRGANRLAHVFGRQSARQKYAPPMFFGQPRDLPIECLARATSPLGIEAIEQDAPSP